MICMRDYLTNQTTSAAGESQPLTGPTDNLLFFELEKEGNYVAVRPSGTEPKIKFYTFTWNAVADSADSAKCEAQMDRRIQGIEADLQTLVDAVG